MKKVNILLVFLLFTMQAFSQQIDYNNLRAEYKDVAIQGLNKLNAANRQWFVDIAKRHPAGPFDSLWVKTELANKFSKQNNDMLGNVFMVMMAYQKMLNKEMREGEKLAKEDAKIELKQKEAKLNNEKIDAMKKEADERNRNSMEAANTELKIGVISTSAQASSASQSNNNPGNKLQLDSLKRVKTNQLNATNPGLKILQDQLNLIQKSANL
jgi:hypothetical protein